ncbi:hypothetical protein ACQP1K_06620 [Sphaerimonospora sp. CA-214678]|uniref:hypothetical protein n=1 Tax=Sphaerimonospora sp. CA-214678 TaxID=3240029 RepID=UPI003D8A2C4F
MTDSEIRPPEFPSRKHTRRRPGGRRLVLGVAAAALVATGAGLATAGGSQGVHPAAQPPRIQPTPGASATPGGGYQTFTTQAGVATSVGQNSISVRGDDGSARTYAVSGSTRVFAGPEGISGIKTGDKVWVIGSAQGQRPAAFMVTDLTRPQWPGQGAGGPGAPMPSESAPSPHGTMTPSPEEEETAEPTD